MGLRDDLAGIPKALSVGAAILGFAIAVGAIVAGRPWTTISLILLAVVVAGLIAWRVFFERGADGSPKFSRPARRWTLACAIGGVGVVATLLLIPGTRRTGSEVLFDTHATEPLDIIQVVIGDTGTSSRFEMTLSNTTEENLVVGEAGLKVETSPSEGVSCFDTPGGDVINDLVEAGQGRAEPDGGPLGQTQIDIKADIFEGCWWGSAEFVLPTSWILAPGEATLVYLEVPDSLLVGAANGDSDELGYFVAGPTHISVRSADHSATACFPLALDVPAGLDLEGDLFDCGEPWNPFAD